MASKTIETDYLVIGCGAAGMAFTDELIAQCEADVVIVDRRHAPGGHWHDAYPFVRLHQPSACYGVNSLPLGSETIDRHGANQGLYERASAPEICSYYDRVMQQVLLASGRVRYFPMCEYTGEHRFVSRLTGDRFEVKVRRRRVDARYLEPAIPATHRPPFEVAADVRFVAINALAQQTEAADGYTIIGAGKTAIDACLWLLESGVPPASIRWIKPQEAWLLNRVFAQCRDLVGTLFEGLSLQIEAAAQANSIEDLFMRLNRSEQLLRIDEDVTPTAYRGATVSAGELAQLRKITDVVRLGHVRRIDPQAITLDGGTIRTRSHHVHVHCAAHGLNPAPAVPMFGGDGITLQPIRTGLIPFNASLVGVVEATYDDDTLKNRLCPVNRLPSAATDWVRGTWISLNADHLWSKDPVIGPWLDHARLNPGRGLRAYLQQPQAQAAARRYAEYVRPALDNLRKSAQALA